MIQKVRNLFSRLIRWQKQPAVPSALSTDEHTCQNCDHTYTGNFCPRCGQSANTLRISLRNLLRIFLDTWGLGTHSLLRTLFHLFTRPGYMIGDYIDGRRQPYFPPFKTLLVVGTFYAFTYFVCNHYGTIVDVDQVFSAQLASDKSEAPVSAGEAVVRSAEEQGDVPEAVEREIVRSINNLIGSYRDFQRDHRVLQQMSLHLIMALLAYFLFRRAPRRPRLNYSENFVAQVYICSQIGTLAIFWMLLNLACGQDVSPAVPSLLSFLIIYIDFKQLYGYGIWQTLWRTIVAEVLFGLILGLIFGLTIGIVALVAGYNAAAV